MRELRRAMLVAIGLTAFTWMVRLGAPLLSTYPELALYGRYLSHPASATKPSYSAILILPGHLSTFSLCNRTEHVRNRGCSRDRILLARFYHAQSRQFVATRE